MRSVQINPEILKIRSNRYDTIRNDTISIRRNHCQLLVLISSNICTESKTPISFSYCTDTTLYMFVCVNSVFNGSLIRSTGGR